LALGSILLPRLVASDFRLVPRAFDIPERGEAMGYALMHGTNRFVFLPPPGWNARPEPAEKRVILQKHDLSATISLAVDTQATNLQTRLKPAALKEDLATRFAGAEVVREFPCFSGGGPGLVFDLSRLNPQRLPVLTRVAFVPLAGALAEVQMVTASSDLRVLHTEFGGFLGSLRREFADDKPKSAR
jgi:hypothetical protein